MLRLLDADVNTLVIGAAFPGHDFSESQASIPLTGTRCPWNTYAIWRTRALAVTGFPLIGDGLGTAVPGGIEVLLATPVSYPTLPHRSFCIQEVTTISLLQHINPALKAVLVRCPGIQWAADFSDPQRQRYHTEKMRSKDERAVAQLRASGIPTGTVIHMELSS